MKIGFIGAGAIAQALASQMVKRGHEVFLSNSRGPDSLAEAVRRLGSKARATTREHASQRDIVVLAVPWQHVPQALADLPPWRGRIVVDTTNPVIQPGFRVADLGGNTSSEVVSGLAPGARVVKVANTLPPPLLGADPQVGDGRRVLFMSGDDAAAKGDVQRLLEEIGFAIIDLGGLVEGGRLHQFPGGPLPALNLVKLS
ncbi:MAG TPA: NADPH-dependent F420 reductase [Burkholderiaceae bacterium]|nr:NADPH-dependent F420 reductase [Burkholderiaceae bacterium]